jgi:UDP-2,3-diacylglucosamine hydrolase
MAEEASIGLFSPQMVREPSPVTAPVVFVSDVHLDHKVPERIDRFERFLFEDLPKMGCKRLFLLGDIFNIWYRDDRLASQFGDRVLGLLRRFALEGGEVELVVGNRDFALCFDPQIEVPFPIHRYRIERRIGERSFYLCHGDDLCKRDLSYRLLHGVIRRHIPMAIFHSLGSDPKEWIVTKLINLTHEITRRKSFWKTQPYWPFVESLVDQGTDVCIQGHRHYRSFRVLEGKTRRGRHFVLPRWFERASGLIYYPEEDRFAFFDR